MRERIYGDIPYFRFSDNCMSALPFVVGIFIISNKENYHVEIPTNKGENSYKLNNSKIGNCCILVRIRVKERWSKRGMSGVYMYGLLDV